MVETIIFALALFAIYIIVVKIRNSVSESGIGLGDGECIYSYTKSILQPYKSTSFAKQLLSDLKDTLRDYKKDPCHMRRNPEMMNAIYSENKHPHIASLYSYMYCLSQLLCTEYKYRYWGGGTFCLIDSEEKDALYSFIDNCKRRLEKMRKDIPDYMWEYFSDCGRPYDFLIIKEEFEQKVD